MILQGGVMVRFLRWSLFFLGLVSLVYSIYKYIETPTSLYYVIGGISVVTSTLCGIIEYKKAKEPTPSIKAGDSSNIVLVNGTKTKQEWGNNIMLGNKMEGGDNSNIIKTEGNNNTTVVNNIDEALIVRVVKSIVYENMPQFRKEAMEQIEASTDQYIRGLIDEMEIQKTNISNLQEKLSSPDIQYSLYETSKCFAKNPKRAEKSTLINLVVKKINAYNVDDDEELTSIDMAINAATKLSIKQIRMISLLHYVYNLVKVHTQPDGTSHIIDPYSKDTVIEGDNFNFNNLIIKSKKAIHNAYIELYTTEILMVFNKDDLGAVDFSIPTSLGCLAQNPFPSVNLQDTILKRTGLDLNSEEGRNKLSDFIELIEKVTNLSDIDHLLLTKVGMDIATSYISTKMRLVTI